MPKIELHGETFEEQKRSLVKLVVDASKTKKDYKIKMNDVVLAVQDNKTVLKRRGFENTVGLLLTDHSATQLFSRYKLKVPQIKSVLNSDNVAAKERLLQSLNALISKDSASILLRTRVIGPNLAAVRAIFSTDYVLIDNADIVKSFIHQTSLYKLDGMITDVFSDDSIFRFRFLLNGYDKNIGTQSSRDTVKIGLEFTTSETGKSSYRITPFILRLSTNSQVRLLGKSSDLLVQRHINLNDSELNSITIKGIADALKYAKQLLILLERSKQVTFDHPHAIIESLPERYKVPKKFISLVETYFNNNPNYTKFGILEAVLSAKDYMEDESRRSHIDVLFNKLLLDL